MIYPVASRLGIPRERVIANILRFNERGEYVSFDRDVPTSRDGGKAEVMRLLKAQHGTSPIVMIGDGSTDLQACDVQLVLYPVRSSLCVRRSSLVARRSSLVAGRGVLVSRHTLPRMYRRDRRQTS
jgi:hypothetical protein